MKKRVSEIAPKLERKVFERLGSKRKRGFQITRILPVILVISISLWVFAPIEWMRILTPWAGAAALICAGVYLTRVVAKVGLFTHRHKELLEDEHSRALKALNKAIYKMVSVLFGVMLMAGVFFYLSAVMLHQQPSGSPGLLWTLPIGGLVLSLFFGETVTRLVEFVDEVLVGLIADSPPEEPEGSGEPSDPGNPGKPV